MATRPTDTVPEWASAANFPASNYPALYPWGDPHPDAGDPTPWSGQPTKDATGMAALAAAGHEPLVPTHASHYNEWLSRASKWIAWVEAGQATASADTHIVETDADGEIVQLSAELGGSATKSRTLEVNEPGGAGGVAAVFASADTANPTTTFAGVGAGASVVEILSSGNFPGLEVLNTLASGGSTQGRAITGTGGDSGAGVVGIGDLDPDGGVEGYSGSSGGAGVYGQANNATANGVSGRGSSLGSGSRGVQGAATNTSATGVRGTTIAGSTTSAAGVVGAGAGAATGVHGDAADGYGVIAESDASSPTRSAFRVVPQDADPTTALEGDHYHHDLEGPATRAGAVWRRFWISVGGLAHRLQTEQSGAVGGTFTAVATAALVTPLVPRTTGIVAIRVRGWFGYNVAGTPPQKIGELRIRDATAGATVGTVVDLYGLVSDHALAGPAHAFAIDKIYTLPAAGARTFDLELRQTYGSNLEYRDASIEVMGVF